MVWSSCLQLVCPPIAIEGGERTKNSYFHVSEIHSQIDRFHIDRHSYVIAVGGGALLDMAGLAAAAPQAALLPLNGRTGEGADRALEWLSSARERLS